jgi:hypothetical protein
MPSDRLALYSQWYEASRNDGMGRKQSMMRALGIITLPDEDADALIDGRVCDGKEAEYVDIVCGKIDHAVPAFKVNGSYYCSYCGSETSAR